MQRLLYPQFPISSFSTSIIKNLNEPTMQKLLQLKIQPFHPNPYGNARKPSSSFGYTQLSNPPQIRKLITCAKSNNRRLPGPKPTRTVLRLVHFVASNFNIVPEPWNSLIRQFGGGNRGGSGSGKGFGWGGFDGWGWRRRKGRGRKGKLGFMGFFMALGLGLWLILGKDLELDVFIGGLSLSLLLVIVNGWNKQGSEWMFGFCCGAILVGLLPRRENLLTWMKGFRPMEIGRRRSKRRRAM